MGVNYAARHDADNPDLGYDYYIVIDELLGFGAVRRNIIYPCGDRDEIKIIRILHEQMDLGNRLNDK